MVPFSRHHARALEIPPEYEECGLPNFNIWGTMIRGKLKIEVRCIRCGSIQSTINTPPARATRLFQRTQLLR